MFLLLCFLFLLLVRQIEKFIRMQMSRLKLSAIPQPPLDSIFSGHEPSMTKAKAQNKFLDLFLEWVTDHGTTVLFHVYDRSFIFTADIEMLKQLSTDLSSFSKVGNLPNRSLFGQKIIGKNSILSGGGMQWAVKRKLASQFFAKTNMTELFAACKPHMLGKELSRWKGVVGQGRTVELHDQLSITFSSYLQVLGFDNFLDAESIASKVASILEAIPKPLFSRTSYYFSADKNKMYGLIQQMRSDAQQIADAKFTEIIDSNPDEPLAKMDLLGHLIMANRTTDGDHEMRREKTIGLVVDDIMTVCLVMDNMVKQLCSLFMFLEQADPTIQETMFAELRDSPIDTLEQLNSLKYTEKCLLEGLRMGPALLRGTRTYKTLKNHRFGAYIVNQRSVRVHFSEYMMQRNPAYWSHPNTFDPERWQPGFTPAPFSYIPFFTGARGCLGKHMAMMMMKLTLAVMAKNFDLKQTFDAKKPPVINQNMAVMRINNNVDCFVSPYHAE